MIRLTIMTVMALLGTAAFADNGRFNLNSEGANGIDEPLRFTAGDVAAAFPSLRVTEFEGDNTFGGGSRMMALLDGDTPVFIIDLAELERVYSFSIFTRSNIVTGPNGWRVGETVLADVVGLSEWECGRGYNEQAGVRSGRGQDRTFVPERGSFRVTASHRACFARNRRFGRII